MKRRWKILIGILVALAVLLAVNTIVVDNETKPAAITTAGGTIYHLPSGDVQVKEVNSESPRPGAPIVLIHCYACSLRWWDEVEPLLTGDHRVISVDLLGFGGSEKPASGYSVSDQAQLVAGVLSKLKVQGAVVVGQSMGAAMAVALAEGYSQLVDRVVDISLAVDNESSELPLLARLGHEPVLGQAMWRLTPDFAIRDGFKDAFAPDFDPPDEFEDVIVEDFRAMTFTSYEEAHDSLTAYRDAEPLDERMVSASVPLMVILGDEDQIVDVDEAEAGWEDVPGVQIVRMPGVGHTPQIEAPPKTAKLIEGFAQDAGPEVVPQVGGKNNNNKKNKQGSEGKRKRKRGPNGGGGG